MKIIIGLGVSAVLLAAAPASAEICSKIGTKVFDERPRMQPVNQPQAIQEADGMSAKGKAEADRMVEQIMRRNAPAIFEVEHGDAASQGWPCAKTRAMRFKDEVARQRGAEAASVAAASAVRIANGMAEAAKAAIEAAGASATDRSIKQLLIEQGVENDPVKLDSKEWMDVQGHQARVASLEKAVRVHVATYPEIQSKLDMLNEEIGARDATKDEVELKQAQRTSLH